MRTGDRGQGWEIKGTRGEALGAARPCWELRTAGAVVKGKARRGGNEKCRRKG